MNQINPEIDDYLNRYAETLSAFDSTAAAQLWSTPGTIIDDRFAGVVDDRETMAHSLEQSYPLYRALGLASVSHECLGVDHLTEKISLVRVRWIFHDANGSQLTDSNAYYILRRDNDGLHACVCIQIDDAEKLKSLAAERGIDLAEFIAE
ncbi:hypothetical protein [Gordonia sp. OPL2]|uniref:hypothetical protein n=1 Tax=Gordonia sp. OPL2 TaxID=2486274 RepID=UPI001655074D|nr:hypothetical protein [Gordonia sp. OPL2]ROZ88080.1 hypothetical protein EEB19_22350 [Gordonia sp. OPL2]